MTIGLEDWFLNFTQFVGSAVTPKSLANVPRPYTEIAIFGAFKGGEIASVLGGCIVHPIYRFYLKRRLTPETTTNNSYKVIRSACRRIQGRFLISGLILGPMLSLMYVARFTEAEVKEKCYKIRCHEKNMVTDRLAFSLGFVGWYWKRFQGAVDGINIALAYSIFYFKVLQKYTLPSLIDSVKPEERLPSVADAEAKKSMLHYFFYRNLKEE